MSSNNTPYTNDEFISKLKSIYGDKYDYSKVNYINCHTKVCVICRKHGEFYSTPSNLYSRQCPKCANESRIKNKTYTKEQFIEKSTSIHGNKYDYSKVEYKKSDIKVCIICRKHGEFYQLPREHLKGKGCKQCALELSSERQSIGKEKFIEKAKNIFGDKYDYSKVEYKNCDEKVCIICKNHDEFWRSPYSFLKNGCPKCNSSKNENLIREYLIKNNIGFVEQKKFNGCKDKLPLSFDFYIPSKNLCIEYDGIQHFEFVDFFYKNVNELIDRMDKDVIKNQFCLYHKINLLRIKYDEDIYKKLDLIFKLS